MSLPERWAAIAAIVARAVIVAGLAAAAGSLAACTVRPLYATGPVSAGGSPMAAELASVAVNPVSTPLAQQVRNRLIFLLGGGAGQPDSPGYTLNLTVYSVVSAAASIQVAQNQTEPTSSVATVTALYVLTDAATQKRVASGTRNFAAAFDVPQQQFAALRAQRDAEQRAAQQVAELVHLAVAQDLSRIGTR